MGGDASFHQIPNFAFDLFVFFVFILLPIILLQLFSNLNYLLLLLLHPNLLRHITQILLPIQHQIPNQFILFFILLLYFPRYKSFQALLLELLQPYLLILFFLLSLANVLPLHDPFYILSELLDLPSVFHVQYLHCLIGRCGDQYSVFLDAKNVHNVILMGFCFVDQIEFTPVLRNGITMNNPFLQPQERPASLSYINT